MILITHYVTSIGNRYIYDSYHYFLVVFVFPLLLKSETEECVELVLVALSFLNRFIVGHVKTFCSVATFLQLSTMSSANAILSSCTKIYTTFSLRELQT